MPKAEFPDLLFYEVDVVPDEHFLAVDKKPLLYGAENPPHIKDLLVVEHVILFRLLLTAKELNFVCANGKADFCASV